MRLSTRDGREGVSGGMEEEGEGGEGGGGCVWVWYDHFFS